MCAVVSIDYSAMRDTSNSARRAADYCGDYVREIDRKVTKKLNDLKMGSNSATSNANYFAKKKIRRLEEQQKMYNQFAERIDSASEYAQKKDTGVSGYIKQESREFRKNHDMNVSRLEEFFAWATTTLLNETAFGRWLNQAMKDVGNWIDDKKRKFKQWYELDGGKYVVKMVIAYIGTIIAVITLVFVAWPALVASVGAVLAAWGTAALTAGMIWTAITASIGFVAAVIAVFDGITKVCGNAEAAISQEDDPGWARRYGEYSSFSDYLRKNNFHNSFMNKLSFIAANSIDTVTMAASVINIADMGRQGFKFYQQVKDKGVHHFFRKMRFKGKNGKMTWGTFKYGMKAFKENVKTFKTGISNTNINRLNKFYKADFSDLMVYKGFESFKNGLSIFDSWAEKGTWNYTTDIIKGKFHSSVKEYSVIYDYGGQIKDTVDSYNDLKEKYKNTPQYVY